MAFEAMGWAWQRSWFRARTSESTRQGSCRVMPVGLTVRMLIHTELDKPVREGHEEAANALDRKTEASAA